MKRAEGLGQSHEDSRHLRHGEEEEAAMEMERW